MPKTRSSLVADFYDGYKLHLTKGKLPYTNDRSDASFRDNFDVYSNNIYDF